MNKVIYELKAAVDRTTIHAASAMRGEKTPVAAVTSILNGVIDQNLVLAEYWRVLLRDVQRLAGAVQDRQADAPVEVKRAQVNVAP